MALFRCGGGGGELYNLLKTAGFDYINTYTAKKSFSAESGKKYLVTANTAANSGYTPPTISVSGGTVDTEMVNAFSSYSSAGARVRLWIAIIVATSSTIELSTSSLGISICGYMSLD